MTSNISIKCLLITLIVIISSTSLNVLANTDDGSSCNSNEYDFDYGDGCYYNCPKPFTSENNEGTLYCYPQSCSGYGSVNSGDCVSSCEGFTSGVIRGYPVCSNLKCKIYEELFLNEEKDQGYECNPKICPGSEYLDLQTGNCVASCDSPNVKGTKVAKRRSGGQQEFGSNQEEATEGDPYDESTDAQEDEEEEEVVYEKLYVDVTVSTCDRPPTPTPAPVPAPQPETPTGSTTPPKKDPCASKNQIFNPLTGKCTAKCPSPLSKNSLFGYSACTCGKDSLYYPLAKTCVPAKKCVAPFLTIIVNGLKLCGNVCFSRVYDRSTGRCVLKCPSNTFKYPSLGLTVCDKACPSEYPLKVGSTKTCVKDCPKNSRKSTIGLTKNTCVVVKK